MTAECAHLIREDRLEQMVAPEEPDGGYLAVRFGGLGAWEPALMRSWFIPEMSARAPR
jgi:hypothetical protein